MTEEWDSLWYNEMSLPAHDPKLPRGGDPSLCRKSIVYVLNFPSAILSIRVAPVCLSYTARDDPVFRGHGDSSD